MTTRSRRVSAALALLALGVLLAASLAHLTHEHPHRAGQELSCAVCQTPVGGTPTAPALAPPTLQPAPPPVAPPVTPPTARAPLSFSPKQSPPPSA